MTPFSCRTLWNFSTRSDKRTTKKRKSRQALLADLKVFESQKGSREAELDEITITTVREGKAPGKRKQAEDDDRKAKKTKALLLREATITERKKTAIDHEEQTGKPKTGGVSTAPNFAAIKKLACTQCQMVKTSKQGLAYHMEHKHADEPGTEDQPLPGGPGGDKGGHSNAKGHGAQFEAERLKAAIKALEEENHNKDDQIKLLIEQRNTARKTTRLECGVCFRDYSAIEPGVVMLPCRHLAMCRSCASTLRTQGDLKCPICCAAVSDTLEIFVPST